MTKHSLEMSDLATYTAQQVASLADVDHWSVTAEGFRRQAAAEKAIAKANRAIERANAALILAQHQMKESHRIIDAGRAAHLAEYNHEKKTA